MFLKPYKVKSNVPLKSSESKRLRKRLEEEFPNATSEQLQMLIPQKGNICVLKIITHREIQTSIYCVDKLPIFFEIEGGKLVPTLYALWRVELLPYFTTLPDVLPKLSNGADLMLRGVIPQGTGLNTYGHYKRGQLVAINLTSNKSSVGVGLLTQSSEDLYMRGGHGSAVKTLHLFGDKLWGHEPSLIQQIPQLRPKELLSEDFPPLGEKNKAQECASDNGKSNVVNEIGILTVDVNKSDQVTISNENITNSTENIESQQESSSGEVLKNAFLSALKNHGKTLQLPLLTSNFYRLYVLPEASQPIDLKKTKYKKLSNFLNEMTKEGFLTVREEIKGVDKITAVNLNHPDVINFITDLKKYISDVKEQEQPLFHSQLTELYTINDATAPFFTKLDFKRGEGIPVAQIKKIVREYISKERLIQSDPISKSIQLDSTLQQLCACSEATLNKICDLITSKMEHSYQMSSNKDMSSLNNPLIQMSLATRSGNKKVTLVSNVECYGIIISEFIKLCKQGAAASTTIVKLPNQKREQLQIQGNQVRFIYNLLTETYKVPPKCILGLELAKDRKKQKKK